LIKLHHLQDGAEGCARTRFYIGRRGGAQVFTGAVDDVPLYDRALTASQILALAYEVPR